MDKRDRTYSIIGKFFVVIIIMILALPWFFSEIIHAQFAGPSGKVYVHKIDTGSEFTSEYEVVSFTSGSKLSLYVFATDVFGRITGVQMNYRYDGKQCPHIGPVFISIEPTILFWNNYMFLDQSVIAKAKMVCTLTEIRSIGIDDFGSYDNDTSFVSDVLISDDSITLDGKVFNLAEDSKSDVFSSIRAFENDSKEEWKAEDK